MSAHIYVDLHKYLGLVKKQDTIYCHKQKIFIKVSETCNLMDSRYMMYAYLNLHCQKV